LKRSCRDTAANYSASRRLPFRNVKLTRISPASHVSKEQVISIWSDRCRKHRRHHETP